MCGNGSIREGPMTEDNELRRERDGWLVSTFVNTARHLRNEFREWIQGEINHLIVRAEALESTAEGEFRAKLEETGRRIREMNLQGLPETVRSFDEKIADIGEEVYSDVLDARHYLLHEGLSGFEGLVRELLRIRRFLDELWEAGDHPEGEPEE